MTHQIQSPQNTIVQIANLDEDVATLQHILASNPTQDKRQLITEIIEAKIKLKKNKINSQNAVKFALLIASPVIFCFIFMDMLIFGPQYLITIKGLTSNLPPVFLTIWVSLNIFRTFNEAKQTMLESEVQDLEQRLYALASPVNNT
ncbi:MAG: hypothetical protein J6N72_00635 [Psychrobacter sp.]|nr:hypothetical protein [Psychrobacter sp.]